MCRYSPNIVESAHKIAEACWPLPTLHLLWETPSQENKDNKAS